jgi:hypothetical protein
VAFTAKLALVPGVAGPLLAVPFFLPDNGTGFIQTLPLLGLFTLATVLAAAGTRTVRVPAEVPDRGFSWLPLGWLIFLFLLSSFLLSRGLYIPPSLDQLFVEPF